MLRLSKFIHIPAFIIALILGLLAVYFLDFSKKRKIYVYPTPENMNKIQYRDSTDTCFEFQETEVTCPEFGISKVPVQA